jgi:anti-sigma factor RsiW
MSAHLGPALTAFVDGELDHARRGEVQVHLAHCAQCRAELAVLRQLRTSLRAAPAVPPDLAARLLAVTAPSGEPRPVPRPHAPRRRSPLADSRWRRTAVGAGLAALGLGGALAVAGPPPAGPVAPVDPAAPSLVVEHASTANEVPFSGTAVEIAVPVSAPSPDPAR